MMRRRILSLILAVAGLALLPGALAAGNVSHAPGELGESEVVLISAEPATFSVTVPAVLPMALKADGTVEVATTAKVVNHSGAPVRIAAIVINGLNDWAVLDYSTDFSSLPYDRKAMSMSINSIEVEGGIVDTDNASFPAIENELAITYTGKVAAQTTAIRTATGIAEVVFTVCWDP